MEDWELILKYIKNEASPEERKTIEEWLRQNDANKEQFDRVKNIWDNSATLAPQLNIDKSQAWQSIQQRIRVEMQEKDTAELKNKSTLFWPLALAASLVIAVFALFLFRSGAQQNETLTQKTDETGKVIVLPDSTRVFLNRNSSLAYPAAFTSKTRKVTLTGEAYFEVSKKQAQPFIIENNNFKITVLGTSFNVSAYDKNSTKRVDVITGKVLLTGNSGQLVVLTKQEAGLLNASTGQLLKVKSSDPNFLSWKTKKLEFKNTGFNEVCERLKEYFAITLVVKDQDILKCKFTGTFENPSLEQVISILEKTLDIKAIISNEQVIFTGKGC